MLTDVRFLSARECTSYTFSIMLRTVASVVTTNAMGTPVRMVAQEVLATCEFRMASRLKMLTTRCVV